MAISVVVLDRSDDEEYILSVDAAAGVGDQVAVHITGDEWRSFKVVSRQFNYGATSSVVLTCDPQDGVPQVTRIDT